MRRLCFKICILISLSIVPMGIIGFFDNINFDDRNTVRIKVSERFKNLDFLILGNSHSYTGIDVRLFDSAGVKAYNLGSPAAGIITIRLLLENYIRNTGTIPKNIILNVGPEMFTPNCDIFDKFPIHRYLTPPMSNEQLLVEGSISINVYVKLFCKSAKQGFLKLMYKNKVKEDSLILYDMRYKGYAMRSGIYSDSLYRTNYSIYSVFNHYNLDKSKEKLFFDLIKYCNSLNINIYIHDMPNNKLANFFNTELMKEYKDLLKRLEANKEVIVLSYPKSFPYFWYADMDHMNMSGATVYTRFLLLKILHEHTK